MKIEIDLDLGQVVTQAVEKIESLEKALTLTTNSREFNRKRVVELEDELERYRRAHVCTSECKPNAHTAFQGRQRITELEAELAESRELVEFKTRVADEIDQDRIELRLRLKAERELVQEERTRANNLATRLAQVEKDRDTRLEELEAAERYQHERAQEARQSIAARDRLLAAATTRVKAAQEILSRPIVVGARNEIVTSKGAILADAIGNALDALSA
jgi:hypothetical protein